MDMITERLIADVLPLILTALTVLLGQLLRKGVQLIDTNTTHKWLGILVSEASIITMDLWENVVKNAKSAAADGKITKEEVEGILKQARNKAISHLQNVLKDAPKKVQDTLLNRIESIVEHAVATIHLRLEHLKSKIFGGASPLTEAVE